MFFFSSKSETGLTLEENTFAVIGTMEIVCRYHINKNYAADCTGYSRTGMWGFGLGLLKKGRDHMNRISIND